MARRSAAAARGLCAGALGGAIAGALDFALARGGAAEQFLPDGTLRLAAFLIALYAGLGALAGGAGGFTLGLLGRATDLGPLLAHAFADAEAAEARRSGRAPGGPEGGRRWAWAAAGAAAIALLGAMAYGVMLTALLRFHGQVLIAGLVGAATAGLAVVAALAAFVLARLLSLVPVGKRVRLAVRAAPGWLALAWTAGLLAGAGGVALLAVRMQRAPRMTPPLRALNLALWAPLLVAAALVVAHVAARLAARALPSLRRMRWAERPAGTLAAAGALLAAVAAIAAWATWPTVTLLPWKALAAGAAAAVATVVAALAGAGARFDGRSWRWRAAVLLVIPLLLAVAVRAGGADRVRKAALTHAGLAAPLVELVQSATDFDRDGYSSLLGGDCDDWNADVHPGAFDWPDDGIDQDCNGHQATSTPRPRPPFAAVPPSVPKQPDVILITVDALRADHLGAYGYPRPTTPRIDELARESVLFKNGWAHSPSTRYSVPAILSGRYESTIDWGSPAQHWPPPVLPSNRLLAEMFKDHGYRTGAIIPSPNQYSERAWGVDQGFDDYDNSLSRLHGNQNNDPAKATGTSSKELADAGIAYVDKHKDEPFFLWMHFYDPHYFYETHPGFPSFGNSDSDLYDGELVFTDFHIGRVLDELKKAGVWDKSIVILSADHGEGLGEHGIHQHGYHIYSQQNKVPFIVHVPGIAPRTVEEPVGHVDLFPSLLNLLGAPDEPQLLGRSFVDLMTGAANAGERAVFGEVEYEGPVVRKSVATRDWHLIFNVVPAHTFELYHLTVDPQEAHDLAGLGDPEEERLRARLAEWMDETAATRVIGRVSSSPIPFSTPLGAGLGGWLTVEGADVKTPRVRPGDELAVDLVLRARERVPAGWWLFAHVTAADGRFLNADPPRDAGFVSLPRLTPGQYVGWRLKTGVPRNWRPGPVTVEIGLYRGNQRAPASGPGALGDRVRAATVEVAP